MMACCWHRSIRPGQLVLWATYLTVTFMVVEPAKILLVPSASTEQISRFKTVAAALVARRHEVVMYVNKALVKPEKVNASIAEGGRGGSLRFEVYESRMKVGLDDLLANARKASADQATVDAVKNIVRYECGAMLDNDVFFDDVEAAGFQLAIVDGLYAMRCVYLVPHRLGIPYASVADIEEPWATGNPLLPSFFPVPPLPYPEDMSFKQRLTNLRVYIQNALAYQSNKPLLPKDVETRYQAIAPFTSLNDLAAQSMLWAISGDDLIDFPKPKLPFVVDVGGYQIRTPRLLPPELKTFFDKAHHGVVVVSIGPLPPKSTVKKIIAAAFKLRAHVLMRLAAKLDADDIGELPKNIKTVSVFQLNDVLGHKKVKLFMTNCEREAQLQAVYHGVPMLGVPIENADMYHCGTMVRKGYGLSMPLRAYSARNITSNIMRMVVSDKLFEGNVKRASAIFRSRPQTPLRRLVYWIEHVMEFGNDHLVPFSVLMPWYRYLMLDILLVGLVFLLVGIVVVTVSCCIVVKCLYRYLNGRSKSAKGKSKTKRKAQGEKKDQ